MITTVRGGPQTHRHASYTPGDAVTSTLSRSRDEACQPPDEHELLSPQHEHVIVQHHPPTGLNMSHGTADTVDSLTPLRWQGSGRRRPRNCRDGDTSGPKPQMMAEDGGTGGQPRPPVDTRSLHLRVAVRRP